MNAHKITAEFEKALCDYTGAPYAVAMDNCSNALFLALYYELNVSGKFNTFESIEDAVEGPMITIPKHTYPSVACEIIHVGARVVFDDNIFFGFKSNTIDGPYRLVGTNVWDSALRFTSGMYESGRHMCLSFTGPYKHLKLGKGGAILTDDHKAAAWFKRARFSGRTECGYHEDDFDGTTIIGNAPPIAGWNFYMMPEIAARGLLLMQQFYDKDGNPKHNDDLTLPYPDLSKFKLWQNA